jgi:ATP-dependent Lon protease
VKKKKVIKQRRQLILTGQLGDVMKESANIALNWIRSHAKQVSMRATALSIMIFSRLGHGVG